LLPAIHRRRSNIDFLENSPDAKDIALGTLRLRAERVDSGNGRVYLIVVKATDTGGAVGFGVSTVVVPKSNKQEDISSVNNQAKTARDFAGDHNGNPPADYVPIGEMGAPVIGKQ
jgi:hypothetical protein